MGFDLTGKRTIITGASAGIGRGIALRLAGLGCRVVANGRRGAELEATIAAISAAGGGEAVPVLGDVTSSETVESLVSAAERHFGGVDILINCAGIAGPVRFVDTGPERFRRHIEVNYLAPVELCRRAVPLMRRQSSGYIVNVASIVGLKGLPTYASYGASKAALINFSDGLRHELEGDGISVSVLCPPGVRTEMVTGVWDDHAEWFKRFRLLEVEQVVDGLIRGMRQRRFLILVSFDTRLMMAMYRYAPRLFTWLMVRLMGIR